MNVFQAWQDSRFVALDLETSGAYPLQHQICELAAVKWQKGKVVNEYQSLIRTDKPIAAEIIKIHGITNEILVDAPKIEDKISEFVDFISDSVILGHHIQFDLGFLAIELEKQGIEFPDQNILCTSLLARKIFTKSPNHRLQTLLNYLNIPKGKAHRALDDSHACLQVFLKTAHQFGADKQIKDFLDLQKKKILWPNFSMNSIKDREAIFLLMRAIEKDQDVLMQYQSKSSGDKERPVKPIGIVRNPDSDFLYAICRKENKGKRFYLHRISKVREFS